MQEKNSLLFIYVTDISNVITYVFGGNATLISERELLSEIIAVGS